MSLKISFISVLYQIRNNKIFQLIIILDNKLINCHCESIKILCTRVEHNFREPLMNPRLTHKWKKKKNRTYLTERKKKKRILIKIIILTMIAAVQ